MYIYIHPTTAHAFLLLGVFVTYILIYTLVCIPEKLFISFKLTSHNLSVPLGSFSPLLVEFLCHHFIF